MQAAPVIEFRDVGLTLGGQPILAGLDFSVHPGEFLCILGPSGCGKSTSLRLAADLLDVDAGTVQVDGGAPAERWREIAFVFQSPRLLPWRTALENVTLAMELRFDGLAREAMREKARALLALVGLGADAHKYPRMLSGGERQRVALARALAVDPRIVLMDEPFSALDPNTRRRLREEIIRIWGETGKTVVFVTHDVEEALVLADRIVLLSNKPTRVLETLMVSAPRPRDIGTDPDLMALRGHLHALFRSLSPEQTEEDPA